MPKLKILEGRLSARENAIRRADRARDRKEPAAAAKLYRAVIDRWGPDFGILVQLGNACKDSGAFEEAEQSYKSALEIMPEDADCHLQYGHLSKLTGNLRRALEFYREAHRLDPDLSAAVVEIRALEAELAPPAPDPLVGPNPPCGDQEAAINTAADRAKTGPCRHVSGWDLDAPSLIVCEQLITTFHWRRN